MSQVTRGSVVKGEKAEGKGLPILWHWGHMLPRGTSFPWTVPMGALTSVLLPASGLLPSALPGPIPLPAHSPRCSTLSLEPNKEAGRDLNYQAAVAVCDTSLPQQVTHSRSPPAPHQPPTPAGILSGVVQIPQPSPGGKKRSSRRLV